MRRAAVLVVLFLLASVVALSAIAPSRAAAPPPRGSASAAPSASASADADEPKKGKGKGKDDDDKKEKKELTSLHEVTVGVYVNQVRTLQMQENQFAIDMWIWFRWKGDDYDPLGSFEVINATIDTRASEQRKDLGGGVKYASVRIITTVKKFFDVRRFPLDDQALVIQVEDSEHEDHLVKFVPDVEASRVDASVRVPGFQLQPALVYAKQHVYTTNYGDTTIPQNNAAKYTRFVLEIPLKRPGMFYFFKLFWSIFLGTMIGFLAFFIKPTDLDPRFGLGVGAIFAIAASSYTISSALPDSMQITLADKVNMTAVGFVFLSLVQSVIALKMCHAGREPTALKFDFWSFWVFLAAYAGVITLLVRTA